MKQFSLTLVALLLSSLLLLACQGQSTPTATLRMNTAAVQSNKIRIGTDATLPPFETDVTNEGELVGLDIDLMKAIANRAGFQVEFVDLYPSQLLESVGQCRLDAAISAIPITDELAQQVDFSDPYYTTGQVVIVKKGNLTVTGRDKLSSMTVGTSAGTPGEIELGKISGAEPKTYPNFDLAFQDLITGYIDAVIADKPRALSNVRIKPNNLKIVGDEFGKVNYGIAICKNQLDLEKKINDGLGAVQADGTLYRLTQQWITNGGQ